MIDFDDDLKVKKIMFGLIISSCFFSFVSLVVSLTKQGNLFSKPSFTEEKMIPVDVCYFGFQSLTQKKPVKDLFTNEAYEKIKSVKFDPFEIKKVKEIGRARLLESGLKCQISMKDDIGTRSFIINLEETSKKAFGYAIKGIEETEIKLSDSTENEASSNENNNDSSSNNNTDNKEEE